MYNTSTSVTSAARHGTRPHVLAAHSPVRLCTQYCKVTGVVLSDPINDTGSWRHLPQLLARFDGARGRRDLRTAGGTEVGNAVMALARMHFP